MEAVKRFLDNLDQIEKAIEEEDFELMTETIALNDDLLKELQTLKERTPQTQWGELELVKKQLMKRQDEVIAKLQKLTIEKKPQLQEMSQKVQASQAYNRMKRGY